MISQLTIFLENEKGRLAAATRAVALLTRSVTYC